MAMTGSPWFSRRVSCSDKPSLTRFLLKVADITTGLRFGLIGHEGSPVDEMSVRRIACQCDLALAALQEILTSKKQPDRAEELEFVLLCYATGCFMKGLRMVPGDSQPGSPIHAIGMRSINRGFNTHYVVAEAKDEGKEKEEMPLGRYSV